MIFLKKSSLLVLAFSIGALHTQSTQAHSGNVVALFCWGAIALTTTILGINALCRACTWSDQDVIQWIDNGLSSLDMKYSQLRPHAHTLTELIVFGRQNKTSTSWRTNTERIAITYNSLLPLHNAEIIIKDDLSLLQKYRDNMHSYNLLRYPICQDQFRHIENMQQYLNHAYRTIIGSSVYGEEEKIIHEKLHQLKQEQLAEEHNSLQRENNKIQQQKLNEPNITIINVDA